MNDLKNFKPKEAYLGLNIIIKELKNSGKLKSGQKNDSYL